MLGLVYGESLVLMQVESTVLMSNEIFLCTWSQMSDTENEREGWSGCVKGSGIHGMTLAFYCGQKSGRHEVTFLCVCCSNAWLIYDRNECCLV